LCIPRESSDDGLPGPKHIVSVIIKTFACVMVTPPFLFVSNPTTAYNQPTKQKTNKKNKQAQ
jgi:hypothetical protein